MRRQRNNIARKVPFELRRVINRMLVDGFTYREIAAEVAKQYPGCPTLHDKTFAAWQRSPDFLRYRDAVETNRQETEETRAIAQALNDGQGPQSHADIIVMEVTRELHRQIKGGQITDLGDLGAVTKALAPLMRAQAAQDLADSRRREADLAAEIDRMKTDYAKERRNMEAEAAFQIQDLRHRLMAAGIDPDAKAEAAGDGLSPVALKLIEEKAKLL